MARKKKTTIDDGQLVQTVIDAIQEKKGEKVTTIDLKKIQNSVFDNFIICQAESSTQVLAIADEIERQAYLKHNLKPHHIEGRENAQWILVDFFDVVAHIFQSEYRRFYKLEDLWSDGVINHIPDSN